MNWLTITLGILGLCAVAFLSICAASEIVMRWRRAPRRDACHICGETVESDCPLCGGE